MKKIKLFSALSIAVLLAGIALVSNSCNKPKPCKTIITVLDSSGAAAQAGVHIKLYAKINGNTADLKAEGDTDSEGKVSFTFKLPCILDIDAQKGSCTVTPPTYVGTTYVPGKYCHGKGIVKLEEGKTSEKTVNLKD